MLSLICGFPFYRIVSNEFRYVMTHHDSWYITCHPSVDFGWTTQNLHPWNFHFWACKRSVKFLWLGTLCPKYLRLSSIVVSSYFPGHIPLELRAWKMHLRVLWNIVGCSVCRLLHLIHLIYLILKWPVLSFLIPRSKCSERLQATKVPQPTKIVRTKC